VTCEAHARLAVADGAESLNKLLLAYRRRLPGTIKSGQVLDSGASPVPTTEGAISIPAGSSHHA
jgi:hypothetical protein